MHQENDPWDLERGSDELDVDTKLESPEEVGGGEIWTLGLTSSITDSSSGQYK